MFTFGILSSHLPYVAFAAFYLFYLFFPSQFKQLNDEPVKTGEEETINIQISEEETQVQQIANYQFQFIAENLKSSPDISPEYYLLIQVPLLNSNQGAGIRYYSPLFSRPPPVV